MRQEWQQFKNTPQYSSFLNAVRLMRANRNSADPSSWLYWANVHMNYCPHGQPYFIAWHRGYLFLFEQQLGLVSGDPQLVLPYWDYFSYSTMPAEFTDPSSTNPLYVQRNATDVANALDWSAFNCYNFQRGTPNAFEPTLEAAPHNPVHDIIGGVMATMQSPQDPIFFLHHANIDRVTHAWALPDGKGIPYTTYPYSPATSDPYWAGVHTYSPTSTMDRYRTCDPTWLGYDYANDQVPVPPSGAFAATFASPAVSSTTATPGRATSAKGRSLGGMANMGFGQGSQTGRILLSAADVQALRDALKMAQSPASQVPEGTPQSVKIVFDNIGITDKGRNGGFYYKVFLNLPDGTQSASTSRKYMLGTLGAFQIDCARHRGEVKIEYPATELFANLGDVDLKEIRVSWLRVDGPNPPKGEVITIGEVRIEISTDVPWDRNPPTPRPSGTWYT